MKQDDKDFENQFILSLLRYINLSLIGLANNVNKWYNL